jgi:hypothetical protein
MSNQTLSLPVFQTAQVVKAVDMNNLFNLTINLTDIPTPYAQGFLFSDNGDGTCSLGSGIGRALDFHFPSPSTAILPIVIALNSASTTLAIPSGDFTGYLSIQAVIDNLVATNTSHSLTYTIQFVTTPITTFPSGLIVGELIILGVTCANNKIYSIGSYPNTNSKSVTSSYLRSGVFDNIPINLSSSSSFFKPTVADVNSYCILSSTDTNNGHPTLSLMGNSLSGTPTPGLNIVQCWNSSIIADNFMNLYFDNTGFGNIQCSNNLTIHTGLQTGGQGTGVFSINTPNGTTFSMSGYGNNIVAINTPLPNISANSPYSLIVGGIVSVTSPNSTSNDTTVATTGWVNSMFYTKSYIDEQITTLTNNLAQNIQRGSSTFTLGANNSTTQTISFTNPFTTTSGLSVVYSIMVQGLVTGIVPGISHCQSSLLNSNFSVNLINSDGTPHTITISWIAHQ